MSVATVDVIKFISLLSTFVKAGYIINNPKINFVYQGKLREVEYISDTPFDIGIDGEIMNVSDAKI